MNLSGQSCLGELTEIHVGLVLVGCQAASSSDSQFSGVRCGASSVIVGSLQVAEKKLAWQSMRERGRRATTQPALIARGL